MNGRRIAKPAAVGTAVPSVAAGGDAGNDADDDEDAKDSGRTLFVADAALALARVLILVAAKYTRAAYVGIDSYVAVRTRGRRLACAAVVISGTVFKTLA
jgi:hypothetical protein